MVVGYAGRAVVFDFSEISAWLHCLHPVGAVGCHSVRLCHRAWDRQELMMLESFPGLLLVTMIILTLILLPYLNEERPRTSERTGRTDELHIKSERET
jgi:hypothetical protein